ncbi:MAG: hypothetical protein CENE_02979 [Candidatus Celerinatantimonas neptuna]|nr:MAG: hypothetical protein CENE_02979 [Candidatus Celerinatantimonas neptuna]
MKEKNRGRLYPKIRLGVSACVIGEKVRFDGGHKSSAFLVDELAPWVDFVSFCPEMSAGLGSPRPAIRLVLVDDYIRVQGASRRSLDVTESLLSAVDSLTIKARDLTGFVFCAKSPSCGMERVKVYQPSGDPLPQMRPGVFAGKLMVSYPQIPCEETGRLNDRLLRESFLCRLFCHGDWQQLCKDGLTRASLVEFHSRYKLLLMAHSPEHYRKIGPMLADLRGKDLIVLGEQYIRCLMDGLAITATRKKHTNVLMHIQGYFKRQLSSVDKKALTEMILRYQQGLLPLSAPLEMLCHHLRHFPDDYLQLQTYFQPYPIELVTKSVI